MKRILSFILMAFLTVNILGNTVYASEIMQNKEAQEFLDYPLGYIYVAMDEEDNFMPTFYYYNMVGDGENIEKVKVYTKHKKSSYENLNGDYYAPEDTGNLVDSEVFELTRSKYLEDEIGEGGKGYSITSNNADEDVIENKSVYFQGKYSIKDLKFGIYFTDKVEILFKDGSKKTIYNKYFYSDLAENNKENAEFRFMDYLYENRASLSVTDANIDKVMKINNEYSYEFTVNGNVSDDYIFYIYLNNETSSEYNKIVKAEKVEGKENTYAAILKFTNSLETGNWYLNRIRIEDSKAREDNILLGKYYEKFKFKLVSENADAEAPILKDIVLTNDILDYNQSIDNEFILDIEDDLSGFYIGSIYLQEKDNDEA